jgi:hypothetical protein
MYNNNIQAYINLFQNQSPIGKTSKIILILFIQNQSSQVPQLSIKSDLENINRLDEEARTSQKKPCHFVATR